MAVPADRVTVKKKEIRDVPGPCLSAGYDNMTVRIMPIMVGATESVPEADLSNWISDEV